jgi:multidrug resistance efflux pump
VAAEEARWQDAEDQLRRQEGLARSGHATDRTLEQSRRAAEARRRVVEGARAALLRLRQGAREEEKAAARAELAMAGAQVREAQAEVAKCELKSPIDGTVLRVFRRAGEFSGASQGEQLVAVADLSSMIVRAEIDERDASSVAVGMRAEAWVEGQDPRYAGTVTEVAPLLGRRTARSLDPADRFDRETIEALIALEGRDAPRQIGLRMLVGVLRSE